MIVIVGASASGKTTLQNALIKRRPNYRKVVTYTTRPIRDGEKDGVDYHFISQSAFDSFVKQGFFIEYNSYREWNYGTARADCEDSDNVIAVLTPAGLRALVKSGIHVMSVYLYVDRHSRLIKNLNRGDNIDEAYRRSLSDVGQFDGVENEVDYIINNAEYRMNTSEVVSCLLSIIAEDHKESAIENV